MRASNRRKGGVDAKLEIESGEREMWVIGNREAPPQSFRATVPPSAPCFRAAGRRLVQDVLAVNDSSAESAETKTGRRSNIGSGLINPFMRICTIKDSALLKAMPNLRCKRSADTLPSSRRQATARLKYSLLTTSPTCSSANTPLPESSIGYSRPCRHPHRPLSHRTAHSPASQFPERPATTGKSHTSFHSHDRLQTSYPPPLI